MSTPTTTETLRHPPVEDAEAPRDIYENYTEKDLDEDGVYYPSSDGEPMAETDEHFNQMSYCIHALHARFANDPRVYVAGDNFLYYERGNNRAVVSPDCYVVFGVEKRLRRIYQAWKEGGRTPSLVIEITSPSTRDEDLNKKMRIYEQVLQVEEYILFDPLDEYLKPRLQGYRLVNGRYERLPLIKDRLHSEQLGLDLAIEGNLMRYHNPVTGAPLPTPWELPEMWQEEKQRADSEQQRANNEQQRAAQADTRAKAEARKARQADTRAKAEARKARQEARRAEQEAERAALADTRATQADTRAEQEALRANAAEEELTRLRAMLERIQTQNESNGT